MPASTRNPWDVTAAALTKGAAKPAQILKPVAAHTEETETEAAKATGYNAASKDAPQQLITLLIDGSLSMAGLPITLARHCAADFACRCSNDVHLRARLQVQLVTFGAQIQIQPFAPITRFTLPQFTPSGNTPLAEAILAAIRETERHEAFLHQAAGLDVPEPYYFLFSGGDPTSPQSLLDEAAVAIARRERTRTGAFYGFGVDRAAVVSLQPLFTRTVQPIAAYRNWMTHGGRT